MVRGIVIILMALDHTRDFFGDLAADPTNLATTSVPLFFTRWVTHFCAPAFFLLTGTGAYLALGASDQAGTGALSGQPRHVADRPGADGDALRAAVQWDYQVTIVTVLWALGWAMIALAALIWLPVPAIAIIGGAMVLGHNLLDGIPASRFGALAPLWTILHAPGMILNNGRATVVISYVLMPWIGVTALGFALGQLLRQDEALRQYMAAPIGHRPHTHLPAAALRQCLWRSVTLVASEPSPFWTLMSFLDTSKYPPSLLFLLMTLGPVLLLLRLFDEGVPAALRPALIVGKVPLFFFVLHFFLIHLLAVAASFFRYGEVGEMFRSPDLAHFPFSAPPDWGASLPAIYAVWMLVLLTMFPLCRWYAGVKRRSHAWWLSYL